MVGHGGVGFGLLWFGLAVKAWPGKVRGGAARCGWVGYGLAVMVSFGQVCLGSVWQLRFGAARLGEAWQGQVRYVMVWFQNK